MTDEKKTEEKKADEKQCNESWVKFVKKHPAITSFMVGGIALAAIVAIFVFLSVVDNAQASGLVPTELGEWSVHFFLSFAVHLLFWEMLFVGIWVIPLSLIIYFGWYRQLPDKERKEYEGGGHRKTARDDSGFSCLVTLIWLIIVWLGGKWDLAFQAWTFNDWIFTWLTALLWAFLIVGIPGIMYVIWSLAKK